MNLDYVLYCDDDSFSHRRKVILEIQGGGETSNTGEISRHVERWETQEGPNTQLGAAVPKTGVIPNNAWKRQLEQVLRKASYGYRVNAGFALAMGELLYQYVNEIVPQGTDEIYEGWDVCFIELSEIAPEDTENHARFGLGRKKYLSYEQFISAISQFPIKIDVTNLFEGDYSNLLGELRTLSEDLDPVVAERRPSPGLLPEDASLVDENPEEHDEAQI